LAGSKYSKPVSAKQQAAGVVSPHDGISRDWLVLIGAAFLYFLAGKAGLLFASMQPNVSAIWPASGLAVAAMLLLGYRVWPAIFIGAFLVNATTAGSLATSLGIAAGNTLEALTGAYLVNRFANGVKAFERPHDIFKFMVLAALGSTLLSATIGVSSLSAGTYLNHSDYGRLWLTWWLGDAAGDIIFAPLVVLWIIDPRLHLNRARLREAGLLLIALFTTASLAYGDILPLALQRHPTDFLVVPVLLWAAFRFGPRENATVNFLLAIIALGGTLRGFGPYALGSPDVSLLVVQIATCMMCLSLALAAALAQRRNADEARAGLAAIVNSSDDAIIGKGLDGRITSWNPSAEKLFGYAMAEAVGQHSDLIVPPERVEEEKQILARLARGEAVEITDTVRRHKDGRRLEVSVAASPIKDAQGRVIGASSFTRDISEQKRMLEALRASEQKFHEMADTVPDILFTSDGFGVLEYANQRFYEITGMAAGTAASYKWIEAIHPDDVPRGETEWAQLIRRGEPFQTEYRLRVADGSYRWFMSPTRPIMDANGHLIKWFGCSTDIDEQKRAAQERERLLRAEHIARTAAEQANRAKDEFLAMLGHELRNPLGAIQSSMEILEHFGAEPRAAMKAREIMGRQLKHLVRLVDDLLDVARVTTGKIELRCEPIELSRILKECLSALGERLSLYQVTVDADPVWINGDPMRIEQIITNMLRNAIEYTPAGGRIDLRVGAEDGNAILRVEDSGVGIEPELLPRVFELFVQDKRGLDRSAGGLGIGLTVSKRLIELHRGTVDVASPGRGRGSVFTVRLPRIEAPLCRLKQEEPTLTKARRRVLIVEDNVDARESLRTILELSGHQVYEAADGLSGVEQAASLHPEVALIDIGLPGMDGYEVVRRIRSMPGGGEIFLIALTGYGQPRDRQQARDAGFDAHLVKPVDLERLCEVIAAAQPAADPAHLRSVSSID
jgi:PAS domain S-box-containing protein